MINRIAIIGSGSWATALVKLFTDSRTEVAWQLRRKEDINHIKSHGHHPRYLSFMPIRMEGLQLYADGNETIEFAELVIFAMPAAYLPQAFASMDAGLMNKKNLAVSIKGFVPGTGLTPSRYITSLCNRSASDIIVISGPCHAEEIARQMTTYLTVGTASQPTAIAISHRLESRWLHAVTCDDPVGIEYVSILKNIVAIASGIAKGLLYGDNFQAVLVSNAMKEIVAFIGQVNPHKRDFFQSCYFGDLLVTAYSGLSRNRTLGEMIGRGIVVNKALENMEMVAEGFGASKELAEILKANNINLPIMNAVYRILHQKANAFHEFRLLEQQLF